MIIRKNLLLLLLVPPPFGGGEIRGLHQADYYSGSKDVRILRFSRKWASKSTQGRVTIRNTLYGIYYIFRSIFYLIVDRPHVVYFSIPKNFAAFLRMIPIISFSRLFQLKIYGELAGVSFNFLLSDGFVKSFSLFFLRKLSSIRFLGNSIAKQHSCFHFRHPFCFPNGVSIPNAVNSIISTSSFNPRINLLYVGELSISKGIFRIVKALLLCRENNMDVTCTFLGEWRSDSTRSEVLEFLSSNDMSNLCHFTGLQKGPKKWQYFTNSHILVHPTDLDGQPLSILEAMGSGLAIISTQIGAIPDTITSGVNGFLMNKITAHELFICINMMCSDRQLLNKIRTNNISIYKAQYTLEAYLESNNKWLYHEIGIS